VRARECWRDMQAQARDATGTWQRSGPTHMVSPAVVTLLSDWSMTVAVVANPTRWFSSGLEGPPQMLRRVVTDVAVGAPMLMPYRR